MYSSKYRPIPRIGAFPLLQNLKSEVRGLKIVDRLDDGEALAQGRLSVCLQQAFLADPGPCRQASHRGQEHAGGERDRAEDGGDLRPDVTKEQVGQDAETERQDDRAPEPPDEREQAPHRAAL